MSKPEDKDYTEAMWLLWNAIADHIEETSKEELLAEARKAGIDVDQTVDDVRTIIRRRTKEYRQAALKQARKEYEKEVEKYAKEKFIPPVSPGELKNFLLGIQKQYPEMTQAVFQFRDLKDLTDEDLESAVKQLYHLGILKKPDGEGE